jgi:hypothetical protein
MSSHPPTRLKTKTEPFTYSSVLDGKTRKNFEMVVARYDEDVNWCENYKDFVTVYNKGDDDVSYNSIKRENIGHLADTILTHIIDNYDNLADVTFFTHGSWNYRADQLVRDITNKTKKRHHNFQDFVTTDPNALVYIKRMDSPRENESWKGLSPKMGEVYKYFFNTEYPGGRYLWACGKIMSVGKERVRKTPIDVYRRMLEFCTRKTEGMNDQKSYRSHGIYVERLILQCFL